LIVDCDLRRPSLAEKLGVSSTPGLTDYLLGEAQPADILRTVRLAQARSANGNGPANANGAPAHVAGAELVCIPAGKRTSYPAELLSSQRLRSFISQVSEAYDLVVIDAGPVLSVADTLELLPEMDGALVCVRASKTTREQVRAVKETIERLPRRPTGIVVTGVRSGHESDFGYYSYRYQYH
jgi:Mrp family chromosome partitioning ATPase